MNAPFELKGAFFMRLKEGTIFGLQKNLKAKSSMNRWVLR